jgi:hypothetical protein
VKAGIGDGNHGFEIDVGDGLSPDTVIDVTAGNADFVLPNSGKKAAAYGFQ